MRFSNRIADSYIKTAVEEVTLIIDSGPDDIFLTAHCSVCQQVKFRLSTNTLKDKTLLRVMFDNHIRRVHSAKERAAD